MEALNFSASSIESLQKKLSKTIKETFKPNFAIAFSGVDFPFRELGGVFSAFDIPMIGCTTMGKISNDNITVNESSVILFQLDDTNFSIYKKEYKNNEIASVAKELGEYALTTYKNPGFLVYSSGTKVKGESLIKGITEGTGKEVPIFGGLAGDNFKFKENFTYSNDHLTTTGLVSIIFDTNKVKMKGMSYSGWKELGGLHEITKAKGNIIYEIDGRPAMDEFLKYFGDVPQSSLNPTGNKDFPIPSYFPLKIIREDAPDIIRAVTVYDSEKRSLVFAKGIKTGQRFKFCPTPSFVVIQNTITKFTELNDRVPDVDAVLMHSCGARFGVFGPMLDLEIETIYDYWEKPMAGFIAAGEIGCFDPDIQKCELHNMTCTLVTLKEI